MKRQDFTNKVDQYLVDPENIKIQAQKNKKLRYVREYFLPGLPAILK